MGPLFFFSFLVVAQGDTLDAIAQAQYGNRHYADVIARVDDVDPRRLRVGHVLFLPPLLAFGDVGLACARWRLGLPVGPVEDPRLGAALAKVAAGGPDPEGYDRDNVDRRCAEAIVNVVDRRATGASR